MHKTVALALIGAFLSFALAGAAQAQNARTWLSGSGVDQAGCGPIASPCRTLQYGHNVTNSGGEIDFKDPAGYGSVTITKAISVIADGVLAGVLAPSGGNAITVNAGSSDLVVLRGLTIEGAGIGYNGIAFNSGGKLDVSNCVIQNFSGTGSYPPHGNGVVLQPTSGSPLVTITGTTTSHNAYIGIFYAPQAGSAVSATIVIDRVTAEDNNNGIIIDGSSANGYTKASITNTSLLGNSGQAISFVGDSKVTGTVGSNVATFNAGYGLIVQGTANVLSFKNNQFAGNNGNGAQTNGMTLTAPLY